MMAVIAVFVMDFYNSALDFLVQSMTENTGNGSIFLSFYFETRVS